MTRDRMAPRGIAFLGCGFATRLHSRTLRRFPAVSRFYASRRPERAEAFATRFAGSGHFGSYQAAIADERVDVVLVATPPSSHLELTRAALEAGKHVIVEKPPFLRAADFEVVEHLAEQVGRRVFVAENYFYKPLVTELRRLVLDGAIGDVRILSVNALKEQRSGGWRDDAALTGGGAFFEGGIHWVNFMGSVGLTVRDAHGFRPGPVVGPDRTMVAVFEYEQGAVGTLMYSWEIGSPARGLRLSSIYGSAGTITFESNGLLLAVRGRRRRVTVPRPRDLLGYSAMFADFFRALETGGAAAFELPAARRDLELVERICRSAVVRSSTGSSRAGA
jgi:UDP-N-acetylglucosamine 3-dehydrogenase